PLTVRRPRRRPDRRRREERPLLAAAHVGDVQPLVLAPPEDESLGVRRPSRRRLLAECDSLRLSGRERGHGDAPPIEDDLPPVGRDDRLAEAHALPERLRAAGPDSAVLAAAG